MQRWWLGVGFLATVWACTGDDEFPAPPAGAGPGGSNGAGASAVASTGPSGGATTSQGGSGGASSAGGATGGAAGEAGAGQGGFDPLQNPVAQINHPGDMECRVVDMPVPFVGTATDPQEGALTGGALVWTSSVDGQIGTGTTFMHTPTQLGNHVITLPATDMDSNVGTDTATVVVQQQCP
jgi:chitinase